jgi:hypothetical protein
MEQMLGYLGAAAMVLLVVWFVMRVVYGILSYTFGWVVRSQKNQRLSSGQERWVDMLSIDLAKRDTKRFKSMGGLIR